MAIQTTVLANGVRIVTDSMSGVQSAAIGCWINAGSRDERQDEFGCSHFLEHLLFQGTDRHSAKDISDIFDTIGADFNAFTGKEHMCYYARLCGADLPVAIALLADMLQRSVFPPEGIATERKVILEEINMHADSPEAFVEQKFDEALWGNHPLGHSPLGTASSVSRLTRDDIVAYWKRTHVPSNLVVAVAGKMKHDEVHKLVDAHFGSWSGAAKTRKLRAASVTPRVVVEERDAEQAHVLVGCEGLTQHDERRFAFQLLDYVIGGSMSSRLFQEIRAKRGLAYSVYSVSSFYSDSGSWAVYVGTTPEQAPTVLTLIVEEFDRLAREGMTREEFERAKRSNRGSTALMLEHTESRMIRLGGFTLAGVEPMTVRRSIETFERVPYEQVQALAHELFSRPRVIGAVGPLHAADLEPFIR